MNAARFQSVAANWFPLLIGIAVSLALLAWLLITAYWPAARGMDIGGAPLGHDFINVWTAPRMAVAGQTASLFDMESYTRNAGQLFGQNVPNCMWSYPPTALLLYYPFSALPYFAGLALWTILGVAGTGVVFRVYCDQKPIALLVLILAPACLMNLLSGQNGFICATLLLGGLLATRRDPILAGIAFGILTFKPQLGLILPFALIAMKAWRTILAACITTAVLVGASILVFGVNLWTQYLARTASEEMGYLYHFQGLYAAMIQSPFAGFRRIGFNYFDGLALQAACALAVIALTISALRKTLDLKRQAFIVISAAPLVTPYIFNYDMVFLAIPLSCALWPYARIIWWHRPIYLAAWLAPTLGMYAATSHLPVLQAFAPLSFALIFFLACRQGTHENPTINS